MSWILGAIVVFVALVAQVLDDRRRILRLTAENDSRLCLIEMHERTLTELQSKVVDVRGPEWVRNVDWCGGGYDVSDLTPKGMVVSLIDDLVADLKAAKAPAADDVDPVYEADAGGMDYDEEALA